MDSQETTYFHVDVYKVLFGIPNANQNLTVNHVNYIILTGKYYVNVCKKKCQRLDVYVYLFDCKHHLALKQNIYTKIKKIGGELHHMI